MYEREKRKDSVVIRGLQGTTPTQLSAEFRELTLKMMGTQVDLTDIVLIPGHTGLCRGKILDSANRNLVLDRAKTLRDTEYGSVYIRKDLTYNQRSALKERREAQHGPVQGRQPRAEQTGVAAPAAAPAVPEPGGTTPQTSGHPEMPVSNSSTGAAQSN